MYSIYFFVLNSNIWSGKELIFFQKKNLRLSYREISLFHPPLIVLRGIYRLIIRESDQILVIVIDLLKSNDGKSISIFELDFSRRDFDLIQKIDVWIILDKPHLIEINSYYFYRIRRYIQIRYFLLKSFNENCAADYL